MSVLKECRTVKEAVRLLMIANQIPGAHYSELVEIKLRNDEVCQGRVLEVQEDKAMVRLLEGFSSINLEKAKVCFTGHPLKLPVSENMIRRTSNGMGEPIDGGSDLIPKKYLDTDGQAVDSMARDYPDELIQTGIPVIDHLNTLARGQKLSVFSGLGFPHSELTAQIAHQATVLDSDENLAVAFATMGTIFGETEFFMNDLRQAETTDRSVLFINSANGPVIERIATPRIALAVAEYLAYERDMHVLVTIMDMTNYCEAPYGVSVACRGVPGRRGYPGCLYTDSLTLYECVERLTDKKGSVTQILTLTTPEDDTTYLVPDLTGHITEG